MPVDGWAAVAPVAVVAVGVVIGVNVDAKARYTQGAGCMQKYGFRLKKKAKM